MKPTKSRVPGWVLPVAVVVLVIALVVIALSRGPVQLSPDTAEGTVQEYLLAIDQERWDDAVEILHQDWRGACEGTDLATFPQGDFTAELGTDSGFSAIRETFVEVAPGGEESIPTIPDDATQVDVTINHDVDAGLGSGWSEYVVFELVDDGEFWWLVGDPWPYFVWSCRESL